MTTKEFLDIKGIVLQSSIDELNTINVPLGIDDLNALTFGELLDLYELKTDVDWLTRPSEIIFKESSIDKSIEFSSCLSRFVRMQLENISGLFESIKSIPTADELNAGILSLNFGHFGTLDWYARRIGISDHDDVLKVKWTRIYMAMKLDNETKDFQRRYQKILANKKP